jgi:hypothetical protein
VAQLKRDQLDSLVEVVPFVEEDNRQEELHMVVIASFLVVVASVGEDTDLVVASVGEDTDLVVGRVVTWVVTYYL